MRWEEPEDRRPRLTPLGELAVALMVIALVVFLAALGAAINGPS